MKNEIPVYYTSGSKSRGFKGVIAGGIAGGLQILIIYPISYVKTQLQLDGKGENKKYHGISDCVRQTIEKNGFRGLYRGLSVLLIGNMPKVAVRFSVYETISSFLTSDDGTLSGRCNMLSGLCAGVCVAILVVAPKETIKVKLINDQRSENPKLKGLIHGVGQIIKTDGISGVYKGVTATILKEGSSQAIRFFTIGALKDWYTGKDPTRTTPVLIVGLFGCIAGGTSVLCNNPIDVVKTRMQGLEAHKYKNTFHCVSTIFKNEGFYAFYKGTIPRLTLVCFNTGLTFMLYDSLMDFFTKTI